MPRLQPAVVPTAGGEAFKRRRIGGDVLVVRNRDDESSDSSSSSSSESEDERPVFKPKAKAPQLQQQQQQQQPKQKQQQQQPQPNAVVPPWMKPKPAAAAAAAPAVAAPKPKAAVAAAAPPAKPKAKAPVATVDSSSDDDEEESESDDDDAGSAMQVVAPAAAASSKPAKAALTPAQLQQQQDKKKAQAAAADDKKTVACQFAGCPLRFVSGALLLPARQNTTTIELPVSATFFILSPPNQKQQILWSILLLISLDKIWKIIVFSTIHYVSPYCLSVHLTLPPSRSQGRAAALQHQARQAGRQGRHRAANGVGAAGRGTSVRIIGTQQ